MDSRTPVRKSGRTSHTKRYTDDAFEGLDISSDIGADDDSRHIYDDESEASQDDDEEYGAQEEEAAAADVIVSGEEQSNEEAASSEAESEDEHIDEEGDVDNCEVRFVQWVHPQGSSIDEALPGQRKRLRTSATNPVRLSQHVLAARQQRARHDDFSSASKKDRYVNLFGPGHTELMNALRCRDKWYRNEVLPYRQADDKGRGGFRRSYFEAAEDHTPEAARLWDWFFRDGGEDMFQRDQHLRDLDDAEGRSYVVSPDDANVRFFMGPWKRQMLTSLKPRQFARVHDLWEQAKQSHPLPRPQGPPETRKMRQGWMMNAGTQVHELGWVPFAQETIQYLAIATAPEVVESNGNGNGHAEALDGQEPRTAPAFAPSGPFPAAIQFWAFPSDAAPEKPGTMALAQIPELRLVLCTNWGPVTQLRWCVAPQDQRNTGRREGASALLAGIWGDGKIRVLNISSGLFPSRGTRYVKVEKAAFESCPPDTVCTCLDWMSTSHIAVGCANGFVAVWDIARYLTKKSMTVPPSGTRTTSTETSIKNPRPFFYYPLHMTYILAIASCSPSHHNLIVTSAMDGYVRVTDIYSPEADHAVGGRSRFGSSCLGWCDSIQCAISGEENNTLRAVPLRRFYGSVTFNRNTANVVALAVGTTHTTALSGGADGAVEISNPLRRVINNKMPNYQLIWFMHEWSRKAGGVVRITEGFKVDTPRLFRLGTAAMPADGTIPATIHEEKSAITHLAWNPNALCGGWAAAAMRSGLVRIEDLAI